MMVWKEERVWRWYDLDDDDYGGDDDDDDDDCDDGGDQIHCNAKQPALLPGHQVQQSQI